MFFEKVFSLQKQPQYQKSSQFIIEQNYLSSISPFNDGFIDYESRQISQIHGRNILDNIEGGKILGNMDVERENSLIESLNEEYIGDSSKTKKQRNIKTLRLKQGFYDQKQKQRQSSHLQNTPSFNREDLFEFELKRATTQQQLLLKQQMIKNLSLQLYNERQKTQKLSAELKILSVQKLNFQISHKLQESLSEWMMNNSGTYINKFQSKSTGIGQIVYEFKSLKKEMLSYQEYIFDLEQENVRLKEMRQHEFNLLRDSLKLQYQQQINSEISQRLNQEISQRQYDQKKRLNKEFQQLEKKLDSQYQSKFNLKIQELQNLYKQQNQEQVQRANKLVFQQFKRQKQLIQAQFQQKQLRQSQKICSKLKQLEQQKNQLEVKQNNSQQIILEHSQTIKKLQNQLQTQNHKHQELIFEVQQSKRQVIELRNQIQQNRIMVNQLEKKIFALEEELYYVQNYQLQKNLHHHHLQYSTESAAHTKSSRGGSGNLQPKDPKSIKQIGQTYLTSLDASQQQNSIIHNLQNIKGQASTSSHINPSHTHEIQTYFLELKQQLTQRESAIKQTESNLIEREKELILREENIYKLQLKIESDFRKLQMKQQSLELQEKQILDKYQEIRKKQIIFTQEKLGFKHIDKPSQYGLQKYYQLPVSFTDRLPQKKQNQPILNQQLLFQPGPQKDVQTYHSPRNKNIYDLPHCPSSQSIPKVYDQSRYNLMLNASRSERSRSNSMEAQKILSKMKAQGSITKRCKCINEVNMCVCNRHQRPTSNQRQMAISANRPARISPPKRPTVHQAHKKFMKQTIQSSYYDKSTPLKLNSRATAKKDTPIHTLEKIDKYEEGHKLIKLKIIEDKVKRIKSEAGLGQKMK